MLEYTFDTSSISSLNQYYPNRFPTFWEDFNRLIANEEVVSVREVLNELDVKFTKGKHWLGDWIYQNRGIFSVPSEDEMLFVREIFTISHFRSVVGQQQQFKGTPVADPFVIARAKLSGGCVITEEVLKPNAAKIPNICEHFDVRCTNLEGFLADHDLTY